MPLLAPSLGWHAYYGLFGAFGAWLALGVWLARRPILAIVLVGMLAGMRSARATTPSLDWGTGFYQKRSAPFVSSMRQDLFRLHPSVPPSSRMYFALVPSQVGFLTGDAPVLRVWYRDPTLRGGYFRQYQPSPRAGAGRDYFFRYDPQRGWIEISAEFGADLSPGDLAAAADVGELGARFGRSGDGRHATIQYQRLARSAPDQPKHALDAGATLIMAGDTAAAVAWLEQALASPLLPDSLRQTAREILLEARPRAGGRPVPHPR